VAAPTFARARSYGDLGDLNIVNDIVTAADIIKQAKADKTSVEQIISQSDMFGTMDPVVAQIATFIEDNKRSPRRMGVAFSEMAKFAENKMQSQGQDALFETDAVTKTDLVSAAQKRLKEVYGDEATFQDLFTEEQIQSASSKRDAEIGRASCRERV